MTLPAWKSPVLLASMASLTTPTYRRICVELGAGGCATGLVDAEGLLRSNQGSLRRAEPAGLIQDVLQLFGNQPESLAAASALAAKLGFHAVELNASCPAGPLLRRGAGGALLRDPAQFERILAAMRAATELPLGVKIRTGFCKASAGGDQDLPILLARAASAGVDWIQVHLRTVEDGYCTPANWSLLQDVIQEGPALLAAGDLVEAEQIRKRLRDYPVLHAVVVARGAIFKPWLFAEVLEQTVPSLSEQGRLLAQVLRSWAQEVAVEESRRVLPTLCRRLGLEAEAAQPLLLADRRRQASLAERITQVLEVEVPCFSGNPLLRD